MSRTVKENIRSWFFFGLILLAIFAARSVIADWNPVPTGSMKPTIMEGDVILVNRAAYDLKIPFTTRHIVQFSDPKRGDIVVFKSPEDGTRLVKRIIGLPGEQIKVAGDQVWINNELLSQQPLAASQFSDLSDQDQISHRAMIEALGDSNHALLLDARRTLPFQGSMEIPAGYYFMMGDHRNNSRDSRVFGLVDRHLILGKSSRILLSVDIKNRWKPRWHRFFNRLDPDPA